MQKTKDKKSFLDSLYYDIGKQKTDFQLAYSYLDDKEPIWSKWRNYSKCIDDNNFIEKVNNRTILLNEVVLDYEKKDIDKLIKLLDEHKLKYKIYSTGSRGFHIHLIFPDLIMFSREKREKFREGLINKYGCDLMKKSDRCMIALENTAHWKTGKPKTLFKEKEGTNTTEQIVMEAETEEETPDIWRHDENGKRVGIDQTETAHYLMEQYTFITVGEERPEIYIYDNGVYIPKGKVKIKRKCEEWSEGQIKVNDINEILGHVERKTYKEREELYSTDKDLICVDNGILNLKTLDIGPHTPKLIFTQKIPVKFVSGADCPNIKKFFDEILENREDDINTMQEFLGSCLERTYWHKKALIFVGESNTGKTTTLKLIEKIFGKNNISSVSLHQLIYDRFASCNLQHKLLNFYDDLPFQDIKKTGTFKIATGDGFVSAEKKFGEHYFFRSYAKLLFATNKISKVEDTDDDAYYSRWLIFFFNKVFPKNEGYLESIMTPNELSGALNWILEGLKRLKENKNFSYNKTAEENKLVMERSSDTVAAFMQDCIMQKDNNFISKQAMYELYGKYVLEFGGAKVTKEKLGREISTRYPYIVEGQRTWRGKKGVPCWTNLDLNPDLKQKVKTFSTFLDILFPNERPLLY